MGFRRKTGCQCPISFQQVFSWLVYVYSMVVYLTQVLPDLSSYFLVVFSASAFFTFSLVAVLMALLTKSNPSDPIVEEYLISADEGFKNKLIEENKRYCNYCDAPVSNQKTKHCLRCNRCTLGFDHHCKFVNNCVGAVNYRLFILLVIGVEIHELTMTGIYVWYLVEFYFRFSGYFGFIIVALLKSLVVVSLNTYLLAFHCYLRKVKMSTFEFLTGSRRKLETYVHPGQNLSDTNLNI